MNAPAAAARARTVAILLVAAGLHHAAALRAEEASAATAGTNAAPKKLMLLRASTTPLGENSVLAVSAEEARRELEAMRSGLLRERLREPLPKSVAEQGGASRMLLKDPKPRKILGLFNLGAPLDAETRFRLENRVNGFRGTPPQPLRLSDPIWFEPEGINLFNWGW